MNSPFRLRLATEADIPALEELIPLSVRELQAATYSREQMEAALGPVFGVDRLLIQDRTYFVIEEGKGGRIVGCGGWSRRPAVFGGDRGRNEGQPMLDPATDPARVRAFFIHPDCARRGLGRAILQACEEAMIAAGFRQAILVATLAGEPLYASAGYGVTDRVSVPMAGGLILPVVHMAKSLSAPSR